MSHRYRPVGWTPAKRLYDAVLALCIAAYLLLHTRLGPRLQDPVLELDPQSQAIKAHGSLAFILLTLALAIGPLARLDRRFLPLLYNRRHLGVATFVVAASHAMEVLGWHFAFSPTPQLVAAFASEPLSLRLVGLAFIPFGAAALLILALLAATSHDFWLSFLTPPVWKSLHMLIYAAYALAVAHVAFGYFQAATTPVFALLVLASAIGLVVLHLVAARRAEPVDAPPAPEPPWLRAGQLAAIAEGRGIVVHPPGAEAVAIFRHDGRLSAVSNLCAHQNGPLGEGCVRDGLITCPWHGFQYRLADGCAPPPFTEKLATFRLRLVGEEVWLDPRPNPPGTFVEPVALPEAAR
jgi:nitrite reductase/ring-hydroxylating ferredoxin subunit/DMSO/TMAO reductase YedYZ heme-binding membrane subunit